MPQNSTKIEIKNVRCLCLCIEEIFLLQENNSYRAQIVSSNAYLISSCILMNKQRENVSCLHPSMLSSIPQTNYSVWFSWSNVFPMFITRKISSLAKVFYSHLFFNFPMTCMKRKISHHLPF